MTHAESRGLLEYYMSMGVDSNSAGSPSEPEGLFLSRSEAVAVP
jgi:hypothetical protein